jgi:alpha/beta superfamily hydrolase
VLGFLTLFRTTPFYDGIQQLARSQRGAVLIIYGTRDQFTSSTRYASWVETLKPNDVQVAVIEDADHFWASSLEAEALRGAIASWLDTP